MLAVMERLGRLGVWAVCAAALGLSSAARATQGPEFDVSGRSRLFVFAADQDKTATDRLKDVDAFANAAAYLDSKTIFDNGIELRTVVELDAYFSEAFGDADSLVRADRAYADVNTAFGRLRFGKREGENATLLGDPAPQAFLSTTEEIVGDAIKPRTAAATRDAATFKRYADQDFGVAYELPSIISGVKAGVSFHPRTGTDTRTVGRVRSAKNGLDVTARYDGRYSGGTYRLAAGYFHSDSRKTGGTGTQAWNAQIGLSYGGWEATGTYLRSNPETGPDEQAWAAGVLYGIGPFKVSADYRFSRRAPASAVQVAERIQHASLQANYRLKQGVNLGITLFHARQRDDVGRPWDATGVLTGLKLSF